MALITNTTVVNCGSVATGETIVLTHASCELVDANKQNRVLFSGALRAQRTLVENDPINLPIGDLDMELPPGVLQDAAIVAFLQAGIATYDGNWTIRLGTGDMGSDGTANQPAGSTGYTAATGVALTVQAS